MIAVLVLGISAVLVWRSARALAGRGGVRWLVTGFAAAVTAVELGLAARPGRFAEERALVANGAVLAAAIVARLVIWSRAEETVPEAP
jgi:hypothetical protein